MMSPDHHTVWANTLCLERAGLLQGAAMPAGHEVVMGPDGLATGELLEFEAFDPVLALAGVARMYVGIATGGEPAGPVPAAEREVDKAHIERGMRHCAALGLTTLISMDGTVGTGLILAVGGGALFDEVLELTPEEAAVVELKLRLSDALRARRTRLRLSQDAVATRLGSSQSRVAKMEAGDASVSLDLLVRALVGLGATPNDVAKAMQTPKRRAAA
jgi:predicted amidohydrolase YtcJ